MIKFRWRGQVAPTTRRRWDDDIGMHLREICVNARNWNDLAQDRKYWRALVNAVLNCGFHNS